MAIVASLFYLWKKVLGTASIRSTNSQSLTRIAQG
jgi:hypothetical protein